MNIEQHMKLSKSDRQKHIDTNTKCYGYVIKQGPRKGQMSDHKRYARQSLLDFHQIEDFRSLKIHTCHLCPNDSTTPSGYVCINPQHLYFGSASENQYDKHEDVRKNTAAKGATKGASLGGKKTGVKNGPKNAKKALEKGRHICQQLMICPRCGFEGKGAVMKRWHFDNCKNK